MTTADVVIGGGGIIGLSAALELARAGLKVSVLERGRAMAEASWAAAGMLAAEDPENPPQLAEVSALSRTLYPDFLDAVERGSGRLVPLRTSSTLQATEPGGVYDCRATATRSFISAEKAEQQIEGLQTGGRSLLWLDEPSLDPRDLCAALPLAAIQAGARIEERTEVLAVEAEQGGIKVTTRGGTVSAAAFVNCCGAWAAALRPFPGHQEQQERQNGSSGPEPTSGHPAGRAFEVEPRKGQMVTVRLKPPASLAYVLRTPGVYLVPRGDGRVVIGATVERAGFDRRVEEAAVRNLLQMAVELWPPVAHSTVVESWSGLRPGTKDGLPLIGSAGLPHSWLATGHFRNGILLAPATAVLVRELIEGKSPSVPIGAFCAEL